MNETFVVYMAALNVVNSNLHLSQHTQIALLEAEKVTIPFKYADYTNVLSPNSASELLKHTGINDHFIDMINDKQPPYGPIYSLGPVGLKTLKTYIETNWANGFIRPFKSLATALILFIRKKNDSL